MLVPLSWLKDYVPLPSDPAALVERLTIAGLESSGVRVFGLPAPPTLRVKPEDAGLTWERTADGLAELWRQAASV